MSLQKSRLRRAKNVIFSLLGILVDRPMGGLNIFSNLKFFAFFHTTQQKLRYQASTRAEPLLLGFGLKL